MSMVTVKSTANTVLPQTFNLEEDKTRFRDASFPSYLSSQEETFVRKLAESSRISLVKSDQEEHLQQGGKKEEDGEIGVFGAEKYFNGKMDDESPRIIYMGASKYLFKKDEQLITRKFQIQSGTPSVRSESSWNSQSALLKSAPRRKSSQPMKNKAHGKSFLAGIGCKCSCSDKNSVQVSEQVGEISFNKNEYGAFQGKESTKKPILTALNHNDLVEINKPHSESWINENFHFKKSDKLVGNLPIEVKFHQEEEEAEKPRKSLEVFGSPLVEKKTKSFGLERKQAIPSWDATPRMDEIEYSATSSGNYNDTESDASSDLFEIESLTGKAKPFLARQASDARSGCVTPTTCYATSEASIEWSVVTASAADFSVMSDVEDQTTISTIRSPIRAASTSLNGKTRTRKETNRQYPSMLLGCKSHKAVRVAREAYRINEKPASEPPDCCSSDSLHQGTRFQPDQSKLGSISSRHGQSVFAPQKLQHSQTSHGSHVLYI